MCPMADMLNMGPTIGHCKPNCDWYFSAASDSEGVFIMKAMRNIVRGEEIRDSYGDTPCNRLFMSYGFYIDNPAHVKLLTL